MGVADHTVIDVQHTSQNTGKTLIELLNENVPAWISDYGGGAAKTISLRSAGDSRTLILVDGMRLASTGNDAGGDLGDISPEIVKKIEIVEGGQSALYGMDAMGGVVNIITKRPQSEKVTGNVSASMSSYEPEHGSPTVNTADYSLSLGQKTGMFEWLSGAAAKISDGAFDYQDATGNWALRTNNGFNEWNIFQRLALCRDNFSLGLTGNYASRMIENPGSTSYSDPATTPEKHRSAIARWIAECKPIPGAAINIVDITGQYSLRRYQRLHPLGQQTGLE